MILLAFAYLAVMQVFLGVTFATLDHYYARRAERLRLPEARLLTTQS